MRRGRVLTKEDVRLWYEEICHANIMIVEYERWRHFVNLCSIFIQTFKLLNISKLEAIGIPTNNVLETIWERENELERMRERKKEGAKHVENKRKVTKVKYYWWYPPLIVIKAFKTKETYDESLYVIGGLRHHKQKWTFFREEKCNKFLI